MATNGLQLVPLFVLLWTCLHSAESEMVLVSVDIGYFFKIRYNKNDIIVCWPYKISHATDIIRQQEFIYNRTVLYIPDLEDVTSAFHNDISGAYIHNNAVNYLQILWSDLVLPEDDQLKALGKELAEFILQMFKAGVMRESFHLLAYAEGNILAGYIAQEIMKQTSQQIKLHRITSLNPPRSEDQSINIELITKDIADFVDAIHTNVPNSQKQFGIGHVDFWPNGGYAPQPGCDTEDPTTQVCSHKRLKKYWIESISRSPEDLDFIAYPMSDFGGSFVNESIGLPIPMGIDCPLSARGNYYLMTNSKKPYASGPYKI